MFLYGKHLKKWFKEKKTNNFLIKKYYSKKTKLRNGRGRVQKGGAFGAGIGTWYVSSTVSNILKLNI